MNIIFVSNNEITSANAITHTGLFHADEVMSTVLLSKIMPEVRLCRTFKVPENISEDIIVYDIGGGAFDHHQKGFSEARENGIKFSSFGLLWRKFGMDYLKSISRINDPELVFNMFDNSFVTGIDAVDNGQVERSGTISVMSVSGVISSFNPNWDEKIDSNSAFLRAVGYAEVIFDNALNSAISKAKAKGLVEKAIETSVVDNILILDEFMPWQEYVFNSENPKAADILYVVFPSNRGGYNVNAVPDVLGGFGQRKPLPKSWAGCSGKELANITGIPTANFCHPARFICGAETFEDAFAMAKLAVEAEVED